MKSTFTHIAPSNKMPLLPLPRPGRVEIICHATKATEVFIAGDFNQWNPRSTPLFQDANGIWRALLLLTPGLHEYRFIVDGTWQSDPRAVRSVANPFGSRNSVVQVM